MDHEKKDDFDVIIDEIPDIEKEVGEAAPEEVAAEADVFRKEPQQERFSEPLTGETSDGQGIPPTQGPNAEEPVEELIFGEDDKISLFEEPEEEEELIHIFDDIESDLPDMDEEEDEDLVFVDAVSVRDRRKIEKIKKVEVPEDVEVEKKKTRRRTHDVNEIKKDRSIAFAKKNIVFIGIGILVLVIIIGAIVVGVKNFKEKHSTVPKTSASEESYQVEAQEAINKLMNSYFAAVADNDTYVLNEVLTPVFDNEMEYIHITSSYIDGFENIVCYATNGIEDGDYIVGVYYELKYSKIKDAAPGMQFFYVETDTEDGLYINNLYSRHNLLYKESEANADIINLISAYQTDPDMQSIVAQVQTSYDEAVASNENLKEMVEVTLPEALSGWTASMEVYLDVQGENTVPDPDGTAVEDPEGTGAEEPSTGAAETAADGFVYATDAVNIRQEPSTESEKLASVTYGAELSRLAVTDNGWTKINTGDITGYVKSEYLSEERPSGSGLSPGSTVTLKDTVNVRAGKSETSEQVTVVLAGKSVTIVEGDSEGWTKVQYAGATGYIRTDLLMR